MKTLAIVSAFVLAVCLAAVNVSAGFKSTYQNPLTAQPPIVRPNTTSCTVTLANNFAFTFNNPDVGTFTPPAGCPGPWSKVVLDFYGSVKGVQFDRIGGVWIGQTELLRTSTPEPTQTGISWHVEKDVTEYSSLFENPNPQQSIVAVPNYVTGPYTGIIYVTAKLTFYEPGPGFPAATGLPDRILHISTGGSSPYATLSSPSASVSAPLTLPANTTHAILEVYATPHICDEFWYANAPTSFAGSCGGGTAFREIQVYIDGQLAGVAWPFPEIYTGGINPLLWRPIPSVNAFNIHPYRVDLTPFAGLLDDGNSHTISVKVYNAEYFWLVDADLLLNTDPQLSTVTGNVTSWNIDAAPQENTQENLNANSALFGTSAARSLSVSGYVNTSAGMITTTVSEHFSFANSQTWNLVNYLENLKGTEVADESISTTDGAGNTTVKHTVYSFPISVASMFQIPHQGQGSFFVLPVNVNQNFLRTFQVTENGATTFASSLSDTIQAAAMLSEGSHLVKTGSTGETYIYRDSTGVCYNHSLQASQGYVESDTLGSNCSALTLP
jgi:hypothetical protein